jgi:hypothetical protein
MLAIASRLPQRAPTSHLNDLFGTDHDVASLLYFSIPAAEKYAGRRRGQTGLRGGFGDRCDR